jgi:hypothetical protein
MRKNLHTGRAVWELNVALGEREDFDYTLLRF